jgi:hypothetical protein
MMLSAVAVIIINSDCRAISAERHRFLNKSTAYFGSDTNPLPALILIKVKILLPHLPPKTTEHNRKFSHGTSNYCSVAAAI